MTRRSSPPGSAKGFEHPVSFWLGTAFCTAGVLLHLPMYLGARDTGYRMNGMPMDDSMLVGMGLIVAGLGAVFYGLLPRRSGDVRRASSRYLVRALDDAPIRKPHVALLLAMFVAITIDVMKPVTLAFVTPGMAREYGLLPADTHSHVTVAWVPLVGIIGTVLGSVLWGSLGDRIGRRSSILFAAALFLTTAICGTMPSFGWNLFMCLMMGLGAGGMLPVAFTLLAETMPTRHRGWLMVLIGGNGVGAYLLVSWLSATLAPTYSWRILWLIGLPTGLVFLAASRWIPESPRYLLARGRAEEAAEIVARYGATISEVPESEQARDLAEPSGRAAVFGPRILGTTLAVLLLGVGIGLVTFGFQQWVPTNLQRLGYSSVKSDYTVRNAALLGLPLTALAAWMYGTLGSRRTLVSLTALTASTLGVFALLGDQVIHHRTLLSLLLVVPIAGISSLAAVTVGYAAEVYPTVVRTRGTALAAAMTKAGGVLILAIVVGMNAVPTIGATALIGAVPLVVAALAVARFGPETKARGLETITKERVLVG
ncbi:MFS transporter [Streptomyces sp. MS06]|uniref:MFS transporter n=1 Tax=Streptomyces sp. MS06 TaxID=3385974 RepID=UPI0039A12CEA